jgi:translation initiation factor IF-2
MGKKVFEIAKELGLDHREVMKRCDQLNVGVKTYMSDLSDADAATVKSSFEAERNPKAAEEKAGLPGVLRRKRPEPAPAPVAPKPVVPLKPPVQQQAPVARQPVGVISRPPGHADGCAAATAACGQRAAGASPRARGRPGAGSRDGGARQRRHVVAGSQRRAALRARSGRGAAAGFAPTGTRGRARSHRRPTRAHGPGRLR